VTNFEEIPAMERYPAKDQKILGMTINPRAAATRLRGPDRDIRSGQNCGTSSYGNIEPFERRLLAGKTQNDDTVA